MSEAELADLAKFLEGAAGSFSAEDVAYATYVGLAVPGEKQHLIRRLLPKLLLIYRKNLIEWFEVALVRRANVGGGGVGIKAVSEGLASFVEKIPNALTNNKAPKIGDFMAENEYFLSERLDPVALKIFLVVKADAQNAGVLGQGKTAANMGLSLQHDPNSNRWYIPTTESTYPVKETLKTNYGFKWNPAERRWEVPSLSTNLTQDFTVQPQEALVEDAPSVREWFFTTWLPANIDRFTKVFSEYAKSAQSSYKMLFSVSGEKVDVKFTRQISTAWEAVEELRYRYTNRHGRESWLEVMDRFVDLTQTTSPSKLPLIIDRINNLQHSNGLFMEHFPADVKSWYGKFLNAKYSTPTADELAKFIHDQELRDLLMDLSNRSAHAKPQDWRFAPPPAYGEMVKDMAEMGDAVNWRKRQYPKYKGFIQIDRFDPAVQRGMDTLRDLQSRREKLLGTEPKTEAQYTQNSTDWVQWTTEYNKTLSEFERSLEAQRQQELRDPGHAVAWESRNFPKEFLARFPYSVPGATDSELAQFLVRYGSLLG